MREKFLLSLPASEMGDGGANPLCASDPPRELPSGAHRIQVLTGRRGQGVITIPLKEKEHHRRLPQSENSLGDRCRKPAMYRRMHLATTPPPPCSEHSAGRVCPALSLQAQFGLVHVLGAYVVHVAVVALWSPCGIFSPIRMDATVIIASISTRPTLLMWRHVSG